MGPKQKKPDHQQPKKSEVSSNQPSSTNLGLNPPNTVQLQVQIVESAVLNDEKKVSSMYVQVITDWTDGIVSEIFNAGAPSLWTSSLDINSNLNVKGIWTQNLEIQVGTPEKRKLFQANPAIFVVSFIEAEDGQKIPVHLVHLDCSSFFVQVVVLSSRSADFGGYHLTASIRNTKPLLSPEMISSFKPVTLRLRSIQNLPILKNEPTSEISSRVYIFGHLKFGNCSRMVYARPNSHEGNSSKFPISYSTTVLGALEEDNDKAFEESLQVSTFTLHLFDQPYWPSAFTPSSILNYNTILRPPSSSTEEVKEDKRGKHPPKSGKTAAVAPPSMTLPPLSPEADKFLISCIMRSLESSRAVQMHGEIRFRLEQLLDTSPDRSLQFERKRMGGSKCSPDDAVTVRCKMTSEVIMCKPEMPGRITRPKEMLLANTLSGLGGLEDLPSQANRFSRFLESETSVKIEAELLRRFKDPDEVLVPEVPPVASTIGSAVPSVSSSFTRMVLIFKYDDDETLAQIVKVIAEVNHKALPDIQGSLRAYRLSEQEEAAVKSGGLDIVCGFSVIDDDMRLVVLEGKAGVRGGMNTVYQGIPRKRANDSELKILSNPDVVFCERLYSTFGPDLKIIRLREKLRKLSRRPELYDRKQVQVQCFEAIDKLMALRRAPDLKSTKDMCMYPSTEALNQVEVLYGDAVKRSDIDGLAAEESRKQQKQQEKERKKETLGNLTKTSSFEIANIQLGQLGESLQQESNFMTQTLGFSSTSSGARYGEQEAAPSTGNKAVPTKQRSLSESRGSFVSANQPLDCLNPAYEEYLRNAEENRPNFLLERKKLSAKAKYDYKIQAERKAEEDKELIQKVMGAEAAKTGKIFVGSGLKLNFVDLALEKRRRELLRMKDASFTYSEQYLSQAVNMELPQDQSKAKERQLWTTKKGFVYPAPKTRQELIAHPQRPTDGRILDLEEPYDGEARLAKASSEDPKLSTLELGYDDTKIRGGRDFGILQPVQFSRDFTLSNIGDRKKLPRGTLLPESMQADPQFWKSVHLGGLHAAELMKQAREQERKDWHDKVVVEDTNFTVGGFRVRDRPLQLDRTSDILHEPPKRLALKKLRELRTTTGKDICYETTPLTIMNQGPFEPAKQSFGKRKADKSKFITTQSSSGFPVDEMTDVHGDPLDFNRYVQPNAHVPRSEKLIHRRKHTAIDAARFGISST